MDALRGVAHRGAPCARWHWPNRCSETPQTSAAWSRRWWLGLPATLTRSGRSTQCPGVAHRALPRRQRDAAQEAVEKRRQLSGGFDEVDRLAVVLDRIDTNLRSLLADRPT